MATQTKEKGGLDLPVTESYRVCILAASYMKAQAGYDRDYQPTVVHVWAYGRLGDEIELTAPEAVRLTELGAVLPAGSPLTYDEMDERALKALADERSIVVPGTGAKGGVLRVDYLNAHRLYDQAAGLRADSAPATPAATAPPFVPPASADDDE